MQVFFAIWFFMGLLGVSAVLALVWAIRAGQLQDFSQGARTIFDDQEPVGRMTDQFPNPPQE